MPLPRLQSVRRFLDGLPYRVRLVAACTGLVLVTVGMMFVPLFLIGRKQAVNVYRERLTAAARSASIAIRSDTVALLAADTNAIIPYIVSRNALRDFLWPQA